MISSVHHLPSRVTITLFSIFALGYYVGTVVSDGSVLHVLVQPVLGLSGGYWLVYALIGIDGEVVFFTGLIAYFYIVAVLFSTAGTITYERMRERGLL